ncbi:MAG: uL15 family ribosomal protein [Candidatus Aenigmarchaeota archaeon]|nr:uL15 family ribosomal protein [Candidatus Aenigmarchaeota archaeon]
MVVRKERSVRKYRGKKWYGWGAKKKHRGSGSRGGHGYAGSLSHKFIMFLKSEPQHIGKTGFSRPTKSLDERRAVNVGELDRLAQDVKGNILDLTALGYTKLLSKGNVRTPLKVVVPSFSPRAKEKIEKAGGSIQG